MSEVFLIIASISGRWEGACVTFAAYDIIRKFWFYPFPRGAHLAPWIRKKEQAPYWSEMYLSAEPVRAVVYEEFLL